MAEIVYKDKSYAIVGACFEVYKDKGAGFLEPVYQECLAIELGLRSVPFPRAGGTPVSYKGQKR